MAKSGPRRLSKWLTGRQRIGLLVLGLMTGVPSVYSPSSQGSTTCQILGPDGGYGRIISSHGQFDVEVETKAGIIHLDRRTGVITTPDSRQFQILYRNGGDGFTQIEAIQGIGSPFLMNMIYAPQDKFGLSGREIIGFQFPNFRMGLPIAVVNSEAVFNNEARPLILVERNRILKWRLRDYGSRSLTRTIFEQTQPENADLVISLLALQLELQNSNLTSKGIFENPLTMVASPGVMSHLRDDNYSSDQFAAMANGTFRGRVVRSQEAKEDPPSGPSSYVAYTGETIIQAHRNWGSTPAGRAAPPGTKIHDGERFLRKGDNNRWYEVGSWRERLRNWF